MGLPADEQYRLTHFFMERIALASPEEMRQWRSALSDETLFALQRNQLSPAAIMLSMRQKYLVSTELADASAMSLFISGMRALDLQTARESQTLKPEADGSIIIVLPPPEGLGIDLLVIAGFFVVFLRGYGRRSKWGDPDNPPEILP